MSSGSQYDNISTNYNDFEETAKSISSSSFNGFWSGSAHDNLTSKLDAAISGVNSQLSLVSEFMNAVAMLDDYKTKDEKIESNNSRISSLDSVENAVEISSLESENSQLESEKDALRAKIEAIISSITPYSSQGTLISV